MLLEAFFEGNVNLDSKTSDIILDSVANDFTTLSVLGANDVTIVESQSINLGTSSIANDPTVTTLSGVITDSGTTSVTGNSSFTSAGVGLDLLNATGSVSVNTTGSTVITNAQALDLGTISVGGQFFATATNGNITDSGSINVVEDANFITENSGSDIIPQ